MTTPVERQARLSLWNEYRASDCQVDFETWLLDKHITLLRVAQQMFEALERDKCDWGIPCERRLVAYPREGDERCPRCAALAAAREIGFGEEVSQNN